MAIVWYTNLNGFSVFPLDQTMDQSENLADNIVRLKFSSIYNLFSILLNDIPL